MTAPILPLHNQSASVKLAEIFQEIEQRYGVSYPSAANRKRIAKRWILCGDDHELIETEAAYRDAYAEGASLGLRCRLLGIKIDPLIEAVYYDRLYFRLQASKLRTPEKTEKQAIFRGIHQALVQSVKCRSVEHLSSWIGLIDEWQESIDDGFESPPFTSEVAA